MADANTTAFSHMASLRQRMRQSENAFMRNAKALAAEALSGNGSHKYSATDNAFVTDFGLLGTYRQPRAYAEVARTMLTL